jgi:UDPglucose--hexose-1-phosphate uridylyltransferase
VKIYELPHRRFNPLNGEWVLVSPQRTQRPWQGKTETTPDGSAPRYDPSCYLCPGNGRAGGAKNLQYETTFVFTNDYAALKPDVESEKQDESGRGLLLAESEAGTCKVVCFSPRHDLTMARMKPAEIRSVVDVWAQQYAEIGSSPSVNYVQIFENRGEIMGCSNPHPHGQIWANQTIPNEPGKEQQAQARYAKEYGSCLLCDYLASETSAGARVIAENFQFVALVPFWAVWPFEVLLLSKEHIGDMNGLNSAARDSLADILSQITVRYDNLFEVSFPYSMGLHQAPTDGEWHTEWHFHGHFYPPLLRSATVKKFMVGYEMLAAPQRDITPELAASALRNVAGTHYAERKRV